MLTWLKNKLTTRDLPIFLRKQLKGICVGCAIGCALYISLQAIVPLPADTATAFGEMLGARMPVALDARTGIALCVLVIALLILLAQRLSGWLRKQLRSWWAGLTTAQYLVAAAASATALRFADASSWLAYMVPAVALLPVEFWRHNVKSTLTTPATPDGPIESWPQDLMKRRPIVDMLTEHVFNGRAPVIALHGRLGDGKSSVLNLFRKDIDARAIVVYFSAWLPGSENSLAHDLFDDIVTECRRRYRVPQLRKQARLFARSVGSSIRFSFGERNSYHFQAFDTFLPTLTQREELEELGTSISRLPLPVIVLLDDVDRMHREELVVLFKLLRGAPTLRNIHFICAFDDTLVKGTLGNNSPESSTNYLEKIFPISVRLSLPDSETLRSVLISRVCHLFDQTGWCQNDEERRDFEARLTILWNHALINIITNLRQVHIVHSNVRTARLLVREVNPIDLFLLETIRALYPDIWMRIRNASHLLTSSASLYRQLGISEDGALKEIRDAVTGTGTPAIVNSQTQSALNVILVFLAHPAT